MFQDNLLAPRPVWLLALLRALARHEFLTVRQLAATLGRSLPEIGSVVVSLAREGVVRLLAGSDAGDVVDAVVSLARAGLELLLANLPAAKTRPARTPPRHMLAHELVRNECGLVLELLARRGQLRLEHWETNRTRLAAAAHLLEQGHLTRVPLVADARAVVRVRDQAEVLLIEIDMGTVSLPRMARKYEGYVAWWRDGGPARRFGIPALRVLTIASTPARVERLLDAARASTGGRGLGLLWFAPRSVLSLDEPERFLAPLWRRADEDGAPVRLWP